MRVRELTWKDLLRRASIAALVLLSSGAGYVHASTFTAFGAKTYTRETGAPVTVTDNFTVLNSATQYTLKVFNGGFQANEDELVSSAVITINGVQVLGPSDFNQHVTEIDVPVTLRVLNTISVQLRSKPGSELTIEIIGVDNDPPTIKATISPSPNAAGWNNTNVIVTFTCADATSGIASCPQPHTLTADGANQVVSGTAYDNAGNTASASVTVNLDKTPPSIQTNVSPMPNAAGWNHTNVTVSFICGDATSGVAICPQPQTVTTDGANQTISGTVTDIAGNSTSTSVTINLDRSPPTIRAMASPAANVAGWNNTNVTVTFTCADTISGIASCPPAQTITTDGANQLVSGMATDIAGNTASASLTVNLDKTPPTIRATVSPSPNVAGWNTTDPIVTFICDDSTSGIAICPPPQTVSKEGANQIVTGSASDVAGNSATASVTINLEKSPPTITASVSPPPNAAGWNASDVTVSFQCGGSISGGVQCPGPQIVTTEGSNQSVQGTVTDIAGYSASVKAIINLDKTPPLITASPAPVPNAAGWNHTDVTVTFNCSDALSGIASCPIPQLVTTEGTNQTISGNAIDVAGNSAQASIKLNIEKAPPSIAAMIEPQPNPAGWNNSDVTVSFQCGNSISGGIQCPGPQIVTTEGANQSVSGTVTDLAGNTASAAVKLNIDKTPPTIAATPFPGPNANGWNNSDVTVSFICNDSISGIASCPTPQTVSVEGANQTIEGTATDIAGNTATAKATVSLDKTPPAITGNLTPAANVAGWNKSDVTVSFTCSDSISGVDSCSTPVTVTNEGANQVEKGVAVDKAGNTATTSVTVNLDKTPPSLAITSPANGSTVRAGTTDVNGSDSDLLSGVASVTCNGALATTVGMNFSCTVALSPGPNPISVQATDIAGNTTTTPLTVTYLNQVVPTQLVFTTPPANIISGQPLPAVQVALEDASGNLAQSATSPVTIALGNNPTGDALAGILTQMPVNGVATFPGLSLKKAGTGYTLAASSAGLSAISLPFNVISEPAAHLLFASQPMKANAGQSLGSVQVKIEDANGNLITTPNSVTIAIGTNPSSGTLSGTLTENAVNGIASFADLSINKTGNGYTLTASSSNLSTISNPFNISAGAATQLVFTSQPVGTNAGQSLGSVQVSIEDTNGNLITTPNSVTIALSTNPSSGTLSGTLTENAVNGVATFADLSVNKTGTGYTLSASSSALTAISSPFNVVFSAAQQAACVPSSSQSVLVQGKNVSSYVPNANFNQGTGKNVQLVPIEGAGSRATIVTPRIVLACASNWVTGQTVCNSNNTDVYVISGSTLTNTLTSGSNGIVGFPIISGGACFNCSVAINAVNNQAVIAMGLAQGGPGIQVLDLDTDTFEPPIPSNGLGISEDIVVDPNLKLVLAPSETGHYVLFDLNGSRNAFDFNISNILEPGSVADSAAEDCSTGIALSSQEDASPAALFITDLTQAKFDTTSFPPKWTAPAQTQIFPEFGSTEGIAVASGAHLGIVTNEFGYPDFGVFQLPSTSGSGTPAILDYVDAVFPVDPSGEQYSIVGDPHTVTAYTSPNDGKAYGVVSSFNAGDRYLAITDLQGILNAPRSGPHTIDPSVDLRGTGLVRFVAITETPTQLAFISPPAGAVAGDYSFIQVALEDAQGNIDTQAFNKITLTIPGSDFIPATVSAINGIAQFQIRVLQAGSYTLSASATGLPTSNVTPFVISPTAQVRLNFESQPINIVAGQTLPTIQVSRRDAFGNLSPSNVPITLALNQSGTLVGTISIVPVSGVANFTGLSVDTSGSFFLRASEDSLPVVGSGVFQVSSGPAAQLAFLVEPANSTDGGPLNISVGVEDTLGNIVTSASNQVTVGLGMNPGHATLSGVTSEPVSSGLINFFLSINFAGLGYTLVASSPGLTSAISTPFNVAGVGAPAQLVFLSQPGNGIAGVPLAFQVAIEDAQGNIVTTLNGNTVSLRLGNNPVDATLSGSVSRTTVSGVASFPNVLVSKAASGYTLIAAAAGLPNATSTPFNITPGGASKLVFLSQPANFTVGTEMNPIRVAVEDSSGNIVTNYANPILVSLNDNPPNGTLSGTRSVTPINGVATFSNLSIDKPGNGFNLITSISGFFGIFTFSNFFNVLAVPTIGVSPANVKQGASISVTITGQNTHFQQGITKASFGPGLMVGNGLVGGYGPVNVTSPTTATAQISAALNATPGSRTPVLQTGNEQDIVFDGFAVLGTPFLNSISPGSGQPGQTISVTIIGVFTNFVGGNTQAKFGDGISVGGGPVGGFGPVTVTSATTAVAQVTIAAGATVGLRTSVTVQTGAEQAVLQNDGFLVLGAVVGPPPVLNVTSLTEGQEITSPTQVTGTITSPNLSTWKLDYAPNGSNSFTTFATGTTSAVNGTLDPTLLLNGIFTVRLTAVDQSGQTTSATTSVVVTRNLKVGNFTLSFTDMSVPVAGIPIQVIRTYDSRDKTVGDFGVGWTLSVKSVRIDTSGILGNNWIGTSTGGFVPTYCVTPGQNYVVSARLPDGTMYQFQPVPTSDTQCEQVLPPQMVDLMFVPIGSTPPGVKLSQPNSTGLMVSGGFPGPIKLVDPFTFEAYGFGGDTDQWIVTLLNGQTLQVSVSFGVQAITDRNGNSLNITANGISSSHGPGVTFTRDAQDRITSVTDPNRNSLQYTYNPNGDLVTVVDQRSNTSQFTYDDNHDLISYTDPTGIQPIRSVYDDSGRLVQEIDGQGHVQNFALDFTGNTETLTDFLGNSTTYVFDKFGNIIREVDPLGNVTSKTFDANGNVLTQTNGLGKTTSYTYDANNNQLSVTDPLGNTTKFTYNGFNQLLTSTDPNGNTSSYSYDPVGNLLTVTDPLGNMTTSTYTSDGLLGAITDPLGKTTKYAYDSNGNLLSVTDPLGGASSYTYDANGNRISQTLLRTTPTGQQQLTTQFQYDAQNRVVKTMFPDGSAAQVVFDTRGAQTATIDQLGQQTSYSYDESGRLLTTAFPDGTSTSNSYDALGNRATFTDKSGATTNYTYDPLQRLIATTDATGAVTSASYDAAGQTISTADARGNVTRYAYDDAGRQISTTDPTGAVTRLTFDAAGLQTSVTDAGGKATDFNYDAAGRQTQTIHADGTVDAKTYDARGSLTAHTDAAGNTTQFTYDSLQRPLSVSDALGHTTSYVYDEVGNRISVTDTNGHTTRFQYDQLGRRSGRMLPGGQSESFAYDQAGRLISHTDFNGKTTVFAYNSMGRLLSKTPDPGFNSPAVTYTYTGSGRRASMTDASGTTTYSYDLLGRLTSKQSPEGKITYRYDAAGNVIELQTSTLDVNYTYDGLNRLASVIEPTSGTTSYAYDPTDGLQTVTYPNGIVHGYAYDSRNRLTTLAINKTGVPAASYSYTLDPTGHRMSVAELGGRKVNYGYDSIYRLTSEDVVGAVSGPNGAVTYAYDPVGNRTQTASTLAGISSGPFSYDADDRLSDDSYDAAGNTLSSGSIANIYDFENHLIQHGSVTLLYDGDGNRVGETAGDITTTYLVDDHNPTGLSQVLEEAGSDGSSISYVYGLQRISQAEFVPGSNSSVTSYYLYDAHGSVRALADASGTITDTYDYDAFGNLLNRTGKTRNNYLFAGEQFDPNLGIYYYRARYYDQRRGRFWTVDAMEGNVRDPESFHRYLYTHANPVNGLDPSGNQDIVSEVGAAAIEDVITNAVVGAFVGGGLGCIRGAISKDSSCKEGFIGGAVAGAILGPLIGLYSSTAFGASAAGKYLLAFAGSGMGGYSAYSAAKRGDYALAAFDAFFAITGLYGARSPAAPKTLPGSNPGAAQATGPLPPEFSFLSKLNPENCNTNCVPIAYVVDEILAGGNVRPVPSVPNLITTDEISVDFGQPWYTAGTSVQTMELDFINSGIGSRGIVVGFYKNPANPSQILGSHAFNVVNLSGDIYFLDGQAGGLADLSGFDAFWFIHTN